MAHHPDFSAFSRAFRAGHWADALTLVERLLHEFPEEHWLHWHRAATLEQLGCYAEMLQALDAALALEPDFVRAIVKRARFLGWELGEDETIEDAADAPQGARRADAARQRYARAMQLSFEAEVALRRALMLEPDNLDALVALAGHLRRREDAALREEAVALLDRAIALEPRRAELYELRAGAHHRAALVGEDAPDGETIETFSGLRYSRPRLEAALADYEHCHTLEPLARHALRIGSLLHELERFEEALAHYDRALAALPPGDPARAELLEARAFSERGGAGEREQLARMLEAAVEGDGRDRSLQEDIAAQTILGAVRAIRAGRTTGEQPILRIPDDPDTLVAQNIAQNLLNLAHEPAPELESVVAGDYPPYQRAFADKAAREAGELGLRHVADGEARGLFPMLGQHVLLRFFADESGEVGVSAFAMQPKWPGLVPFLLMLLTGRWKRARMLECVTQFDDGTLVSTQLQSISPFDYGGRVRIEKMPARTPLAALFDRHLERVAAHKEAFPTAVAMAADDIEGMERRWVEGQKAKRAYRASVGYATDAELQRMLGAQHARFGAKVREQLAVLAADYD
jgi:tetratricopeptide (TPR) repeat protein